MRIGARAPKKRSSGQDAIHCFLKYLFYEKPAPANIQTAPPRVPLVYKCVQFANINGMSSEIWK
jgi:hypothetical protein